MGYFRIQWPVILGYLTFQVSPEVAHNPLSVANTERPLAFQVFLDRLVSAPIATVNALPTNPIQFPEGPSTQYLRTLVPNTIPLPGPQKYVE